MYSFLEKILKASIGGLEAFQKKTSETIDEYAKKGEKPYSRGAKLVGDYIGNVTNMTSGFTGGAVKVRDDLLKSLNIATKSDVEALDKKFSKHAGKTSGTGTKI